jgi:hypothetical protein
MLFDQGLGDLFVLRVAGNIADPGVVGSVEYAVGHLHVPLVVVLGHESCGAVQAALEGKPLPGQLGWLVKQVYTGKKPCQGEESHDVYGDSGECPATSRDAPPSESGAGRIGIQQACSGRGGSVFACYRKSGLARADGKQNRKSALQESTTLPEAITPHV